MPSYSKNDIILVRYPFSDLSSSKVRPSKTASLLEGEFVLSEWLAAGLNVPTAVKRGLYTVHESLVVTTIGITLNNGKAVDNSLNTPQKHLWVRVGQ